jgi:hypothetical protein
MPGPVIGAAGAPEPSARSRTPGATAVAAVPETGGEDRPLKGKPATTVLSWKSPYISSVRVSLTDGESRHRKGVR